MSTSTSRILKHVLSSAERVQSVELRAGSRALSAAIQPTPDGARMVLWTVGPLDDAPLVRRRVVLVQTGHALNSDILEHCEFVSTVQWIVPGPKSMIEHVWIETELSPDLN